MPTATTSSGSEQEDHELRETELGLLAPPPMLDTALELARAGRDLAALGSVSPWLRLAPRGDGRAVLVLPGFQADDRSTLPMRLALRRLGHQAFGWRLGRNVGPTTRIVDGLAASVAQLADRHGRLSIVGWSLGGIYAREVARRAPAAVEQVVTLGSPFNLVHPGQSVASRRYRQGRHRHHDTAAGVELGAMGRPITRPCTAIYTRHDGIVAWRTTTQQVGPQRENIEVRTSHCGLGFSPAALYAVADRLAQPAGEWQPFRAPLPLRPWYPAPVERPD